MGYMCSKSFSTSNDIHDHYKIGEVLGSGSFGQVRDCTRKTTNEVFAVKVMIKDSSKLYRDTRTLNYGSMFRNEVTILASLNHPNIVRLHEFFEDKRYLYAVLDKCEGGELFSRIVKRRCFPESETAYICRQMLQAIAHLHRLGIVHRDIKAENFLFLNSTPRSPLILIDFGMSTRIQDNRYLKQLCGSPHYIAPEIIKRNYRFKVDMWALGVVVFLMLFGKYPFEGNDQKGIIKAILLGKATFSSHHVQSISNSAMSFLDGLFQRNPDARFTAEQALEHPWLETGLSSISPKSVIETSDEQSISNIKRSTKRSLGLKS